MGATGKAARHRPRQGIDCRAVPRQRGDGRLCRAGAGGPALAARQASSRTGLRGSGYRGRSHSKSIASAANLGPTSCVTLRNGRGRVQGSVNMNNILRDTFPKRFSATFRSKRLTQAGRRMNMMFGGGQTGRETSDLAFTDPLTGLGNMRRFFDKVDRLIADRADDPAPFTVGILDLDGFKPINDLFGHKAGDEILIQVAMRLRAAMDGQSAVTRVGADEFAFLLPLVFSEEAATEKAKMLIEILSAPYDVGERTARLSASVGCSLFYSGDETTEILVNKAETALYQAKRSGRGRVVVYTREMEEAAKRVTRIEQALRRAVSAGEVEPHFQPIVDLADSQGGRLRDAGALDRSRPRPGAAFGLHSDRRGTRHHRAVVAACAAQGDRGGAQLAAGSVPVLQPVAFATRRPEHRLAHPGDPRAHRLRPAPAGDRDHRDRPDDRSGLGREDRQRSSPCRHPRFARRFRHRPVQSSAGCASSISTS